MKPLDLRTAFEVPLRWFAWWLIMVLLATWGGYPGGVCVTPLAWLIALRVGLDVSSRSASEQPASRQLEAALAGAWLGLLQGFLYWIISLRMGPIQPDEQTSAAVIILLMIVVGMVAGAGLAWFTALLAARRRE